MVYQTNYYNPAVYTNAHTCNQYCRHMNSVTYVVTERPQCQPVIYISQPSVTIVISPKNITKKEDRQVQGLSKNMYIEIVMNTCTKKKYIEK